MLKGILHIMAHTLSCAAHNYKATLSHNSAQWVKCRIELFVGSKNIAKFSSALNIY